MTWRLDVRQPPLAPAERDMIAAAIRFWHGTRCTLSAWVVMDDHVHVVVAPLAGSRLEILLHSWKSFTAHRLARGGRQVPVWLDESYDRLVRDDAEMLRFVRYVLSNPLKRWPDLRDYPWVWPSLESLV